MVVLKERLQSISSCIPALRKKTQMNLTEFSEALDEYLHKVRARDFEQELAGVLSSEQRVGLLARMKAALRNELFLRNLEDEKQDV